MKSIYFNLILILLFGCNSSESKKLGETSFSRVDVWEDGSRVVLTYSDKNDSLTYLRKYYYPNGHLGSIGQYKEGKMEGKWVWYHKNGNKSDEANLSFGGYIGERKHWYANGEIKQIEYLEGIDYPDSCCTCTGKFVNYLENGFKQENHKLNGKLTGEVTEWYPNGIKYYTGFLIDGLREGEWTEYDSMGTKLSVSSYLKDSLIAEVIF